MESSVVLATGAKTSSYGFCLHVCSRFFAAIGGARRTGVARMRHGVDRRGAAVMECGGGQCRRLASGDSAGNDQIASRAILWGENLSTPGDAGMRRACCLAG